MNAFHDGPVYARSRAVNFHRAPWISTGALARSIKKACDDLLNALPVAQPVTPPREDNKAEDKPAPSTPGRAPRISTGRAVNFHRGVAVTLFAAIRASRRQDRLAGLSPAPNTGTQSPGLRRRVHRAERANVSRVAVRIPKVTVTGLLSGNLA